MDNLSLHSDSTLTNRYQTTIPKIVRDALDLKKRDKIRYCLQTDGTVIITRADNEKNDPILDKFLAFLENDISQNPKNVSSISTDLLKRIKALVSDVEIDLNSPLLDEDD